MGVYIKGMEMPTSCNACELVALVDISDGIAYGCRALKEMIYNDRERLPNCPLVSVPPHGRLIDLDGTALAQYYDEEHEEWSMKTVTVEDILWEVCENMPPIIIPADKDGET